MPPFWNFTNKTCSYFETWTGFILPATVEFSENWEHLDRNREVMHSDAETSFLWSFFSNAAPLKLCFTNCAFTKHKLEIKLFVKVKIKSAWQMTSGKFSLNKSENCVCKSGYEHLLTHMRKSQQAHLKHLFQFLRFPIRSGRGHTCSECTLDFIYRIRNFALMWIFQSKFQSFCEGTAFCYCCVGGGGRRARL